MRINYNYGGIILHFPKISINTAGYPAFSIKLSGWSWASDRPFFNMLTDNGVAAMFLEAVSANPDDAWAFVSKNYVGAIDLDALRSVLGTDGQLYRPLIRAAYGSEPKNCLTRSVMVVDLERNVKSILHLHMIKEPDQYGPWKIYGVEQE